MAISNHQLVSAYLQRLRDARALPMGSLFANNTHELVMNHLVKIVRSTLNHVDSVRRIEDVFTSAIRTLAEFEDLAKLTAEVKPAKNYFCGDEYEGEHEDYLRVVVSGLSRRVSNRLAFEFLTSNYGKNCTVRADLANLSTAELFDYLLQPPPPPPPESKITTEGGQTFINDIPL